MTKQSVSNRDELPESTVTMSLTALAAGVPGSDKGVDAMVEHDDLSTLRNATVMMVDDEAMVIEVVQTFLQEAGFSNFIRVTEPSTVLAVMTKERPDLVLMDLRMPQMTGFDILAAIRRNPELRFIPVIILTAESDPLSKLRALDLGAADFLTKPVDSSELQLRVRNALAFKMYRDRLVDHDGLTGLLNRARFTQRLAGFLDGAARARTQCVLAHVDLDRFKIINETFGHHVADQMLKEASERLRQLASEMDVAIAGFGTEGWSRVLTGRVSGNGFVVMLGGLQGESSVPHAVRLAQRIRDSFSQPFKTRDQDAFATASIGLAIYPDDGADADALMANAEVAMYQAKHRGRNGYEFVTESKTARAGESVKLEADLRRAIERNQLCLYYQPRVDISTNFILGVEALVRWRHPELGMIGPGKFIPIAEETGLIVEIGKWVLIEACTQVMRWVRQGLPSVSVSVNVAAPQLRFQRVRKDLENALALSGLDPGRLVLELTESMLMADVDDNLATMNELHAMGVKLAMDDFGTGYSSLAYLTRFPLSELKIDRSFVHRLTQNEKHRAIVSTIIAMGRELGLETVAEGVETPEQLAYLRLRECDQYQGYLYSRPAPTAQMEQLLRRETDKKK